MPWNSDLNEDQAQASTLQVDGVTFKTSGNILFDTDEQNPFYLASSQILEKLDCYLEHGMQMLLKRVKR